MEVATLTAVLEAETAKFMANMAAADQALDEAKAAIDSTDASAIALAKSLEGVQLSNSKIEAGIQVLKNLQDQLGGVDADAIKTAADLKDVTLGPAQAAETAAAAKSEVSSLNDIGNAALINAAKMKTMSASMSDWANSVPRDPSGGFLSNARIHQLAMTRLMGYGPGDYMMLPSMKYPGYPGNLTQSRRSKLWQQMADTTVGHDTTGSEADTKLGWWATMGGLAGLGRTIRGAWGDMGWGGGGGIWGPRMWGWGGGGFGRRWFPGMAAPGSMAGFMGFGAERLIASTLGIGGSFLGGILGGGLLATGALGTMAVGAGTNLAGVGQAAGDIKTVTTDLGSLNTAIQAYGKNSIQAADAQAQLNADLKSFSPVARNAVLAASQTAQQFKQLFDKVTGQAEKTGAQIIQQAMMVGEKFLPTIGKFAAQNMHILQDHLQPFFKWLANPSFRGPGRGGGLGIFTNLEEIFQKHFPTAIHAGEQGFELFVKTVDLAAQHLGHFLSIVNNFLTKMNNQDFSHWANGVEKLIGLFHAWFGMFASLGHLIFDLFKPAVGLGKAFAELLTQVFTQIDSWVKANNSKGGLLNQLFSAHLVQLIGQIGGLLTALLPLAEQFVTMFIQIEIQFVKAFSGVVYLVKELVRGFNWLNNALGGIPGKLVAGIAIYYLFIGVNKQLLAGVVLLLGKIPLIGSAIAAVAGVVIKGIGAMIAGFVGLIRTILGIGPAAATSAAETDAAMATIDASVVETAATLTTLDSGLVVVGVTGRVAGAEAATGLSAIGEGALAALGPIAIVVGALYGLKKLVESFPGIFGTNNPAKYEGVTQTYDKNGLFMVKKGGKWYVKVPPNDRGPIHGGFSIGRVRYEPATQEELIQAGLDDKRGNQADVTRNELHRVLRGFHPHHAHMTAAQRQLAAIFKQLGIPFHLVNGVPTPNQVTSTTPGSTPAGFLNKQQAETSQAQIDISNGQNAAAKRILELEKRQLEAMYKVAKTQAERTAILNQLATVASMLTSNSAGAGGGTGAGLNGYALPLALQAAIARADALAALNPNLTGPTSLQIKLAYQAKAAAMKVIDSHTASLQQLIDAWNIVGQENQVIAQRLANKLQTYHVAGTDAITDMVKGLSAAQELQLRELMAERDAHRGHLPNRVGSQPASRHGRHGGNTGGTGSYRYSGPGGGHPTSGGGDIVINGDVILHAVNDKGQLWAELKKLDRRSAQRAGARR